MYVQRMNRSDIDIPRVARTLLVHQGKQKTDLAKSLTISPSVLSKKLGGHRGWSADEIVTMAEFFDVPIMAFYANPDNLIRAARSGSAAQSDDGSENYLFTDQVLVAA